MAFDDWVVNDRTKARIDHRRKMFPELATTIKTWLSQNIPLCIDTCCQNIGFEGQAARFSFDIIVVVARDAGKIDRDTGREPVIQVSTEEKTCGEAAFSDIDLFQAEVALIVRQTELEADGLGLSNRWGRKTG